MVDVCVLLVVEWEMYLYISMGTTMKMMLLFTQSSRIHRENVNSQAIVFEKSQIWSVNVKMGSAQ